uniref:(northern house mosquito) hypothetical protein n=1 Tax=Culex pipiens TaxID=7175 RepID=A0A8D8E292_CULPI
MSLPVEDAATSESVILESVSSILALFEIRRRPSPVELDWLAATKKLLVEMRRRVEEKVKGQSYEERAEAFVKVEDAILGIGRIQRVAELAGEASVPDSTLDQPGKEVVPYLGVGSSDVSLLPVSTPQIHHRIAAPPTCYYCGKKEFLFECEQFQGVSVQIREKFVSANNLCCNCFCRKHRSESCPQPMRCLMCANQRPTPKLHKHHLLLHDAVVKLLN